MLSYFHKATNSSLLFASARETSSPPFQLMQITLFWWAFNILILYAYILLTLVSKFLNVSRNKDKIAYLMKRLMIFSNIIRIRRNCCWIHYRSKVFVHPQKNWISHPERVIFIKKVTYKNVFFLKFIITKKKYFSVLVTLLKADTFWKTDLKAFSFFSADHNVSQSCSGLYC